MWRVEQIVGDCETQLGCEWAVVRGTEETELVLFGYMASATNAQMVADYLNDNSTEE